MPDFWQQMAALTDAVRVAEEGRDTKFTEFRLKLQSGETTGDVLQDYVLLEIGYRVDILERLRVLHAKLGEHVGDLVLIIMHEEESNGCGGFGGSLNYNRVERLNLAFIEPGGLRFMRNERGRLLLDMPIGRQVGCETTMHRGEDITVYASTAEQGNRLGWLMPYFAAQLDVPITYRESHWSVSSRPEMHVECIVGLVAIRSWFELDPDAMMRFRRRPPGELLDSMIAALKAPIVIPIP